MRTDLHGLIIETLWQEFNEVHYNAHNKEWGEGVMAGTQQEGLEPYIQRRFQEYVGNRYEKLRSLLINDQSVFLLSPSGDEFHMMHRGSIQTLRRKRNMPNFLLKLWSNQHRHGQMQ